MFAASKTSAPVNGVTPDPQFNYVTMLLHGDGTNGAQNNTFLDSSTNNYSITRTGNATQGSYSPYGASWSNYFDGSGDYLTFQGSPGTTLSGDFTVEAWVNIVNFSAARTIVCIGDAISLPGILLFVEETGKLCIAYGGARVFTGSGSMSANTWNHVAFVRSNGVITSYINGVSQGTLSTSSTFSGTTTYIGQEIYNGGLGGAVMYGYISNLRIVNGTAVYLSNFTPSIIPLTPIAGTSLFTCQSQAFIDNSINAYPLTSTGNTSVQRFSPFSPVTQTPVSYSTYFDGSGDYLSVDSNAAFGFGTGDFTIEFWAYSTSTSRQDWVDISDGTNRVLLYYSGSAVTFYGNGVTAITGAALATNTWVHYALVKSSGSTKLYVNGTQAGSTYSTNQNYGTTAAVSIGKDMFGSTYITGYLSNFRIVKGTAVYTTNFTPPTSPLTAISGTSLLTCQSPTIIDNSTSAFPITVSGNAIARSQNPFGVTTTGTDLTTGLPYTTATFGGSGYLRGGIDWLTSATTVSATADFTLECWFNLTLPQQNYRMISGSTIDGLAKYLAINSTGIEMQFGTASSTIMTFNYTFKVGVWYHIAITRVGSTLRAFINGVSQSLYQGTQANTFSVKYVGVAYLETYAFSGYISDFRFVVGTALYTSGFVPPAAPLTAVTNTALLCNMTNAGIYDNAMMNDLQTAGNAQISTSVVKYGTGSMYFDAAGSYLVTANSPNVTLGSGNWTMECWIYSTDTGGVKTITAKGYATNGGFLWWVQSGDLRIRLYDTSGGQVNIVATAVISANTWYHLAVVRSSNTVTMYVNGISVASGTYTSALTSTSNFEIGAYNAGTGNFQGYIDDLRLTLGYARYTTNFTPPTAAFPNTGPI